MPIAATTRRLSLLLVLALTCSLAARADEASHRAKAQQLMELLHTQRMVEQISANITKQVTDAANNIAGDNPSPDTKAKVADFQKQANQLIDAQLGWESMRSGFVDVYAKNFTEEELDGIIAFYKTPSGTALLDKMPNVNSEVTKFGTSRLSTLQPELKAQFDTLRKSTTAEPAAPAGPPTLGPLTGPASSAPQPPSAPK
jgi:hypothetical protein